MKFWNFIKVAMSSNSEASAKRINGTIGFLACVVAICGWHPELLSQFMWVSAGLLAAGLLEKIKPDK